MNQQHWLILLTKPGPTRPPQSTKMKPPPVPSYPTCNAAYRRQIEKTLPASNLLFLFNLFLKKMPILGLNSLFGVALLNYSFNFYFNHIYYNIMLFVTVSVYTSSPRYFCFGLLLFFHVNGERS